MDNAISSCQKYAILTLKNPNYLPVILAVSLGNILTSMLVQLLFFKDGSKTNNAASCAAIIGQSEYSAKLSNLSSSYTAELIAILLVIKNVL